MKLRIGRSVAGAVDADAPAVSPIAGRFGMH
jgi:hypothetical protein